MHAFPHLITIQAEDRGMRNLRFLLPACGSYAQRVLFARDRYPNRIIAHRKHFQVRSHLYILVGMGRVCFRRIRCDDLRNWARGKHTERLWLVRQTCILVPCLFAKRMYELREDEGIVPDFVKVSSSQRVPSLSMEISSAHQPSHGVNEARM